MFVNKILSKYIHVRSCFKGFIARNLMVQSEFNLDVLFSNYDFFNYLKVMVSCLDPSLPEINF